MVESLMSQMSEEAVALSDLFVVLEMVLLN